MSIVWQKSDPFAYVVFNRAHAVVDSQTHEIAARLETREEAEAHRDALNAWWSRRPAVGAGFAAAPIFGMVWPEGPESSALLEMLDRFADPERRLDVLEDSLAREFAA